MNTIKPSNSGKSLSFNCCSSNCLKIFWDDLKGVRHLLAVPWETWAACVWFFFCVLLVWWYVLRKGHFARFKIVLAKVKNPSNICLVLLCAILWRLNCLKLFCISIYHYAKVPPPIAIIPVLQKDVWKARTSSYSESFKNPFSRLGVWPSLMDQIWLSKPNILRSSQAHFMAIIRWVRLSKN